MFDQAADAKKKNAQLLEALTAAKPDNGGRGYVAVWMGGEKIHAAKTALKGWGGYYHPRALCAPHTPRTYAGLTGSPQTDEVTCQKCIASLRK